MRSLRNSKKLTQNQLAEFLKINRVTYTQYELNTREPDYETLRKLADYFDVSTDYLLGYDKKSDTADKISSDDLELLNYIKRLSPEERKALEIIFSLRKETKKSSDGSN